MQRNPSWVWGVISPPKIVQPRLPKGALLVAGLSGSPFTLTNPAAFLLAGILGTRLSSHMFVPKPFVPFLFAVVIV